MLEGFFTSFYEKIEEWENRAGNNAAVAYFVLQLVFVCAVNFLIKYLDNVPIFEMIYLRTIFVFLLNFLIMSELGIDPYPEDERKMRFLILRGVFNYLATIFYLMSLKVLSVTRSTSLFYTFSIWIGFVGYLLIKEKFTRYEFFSSLFGIAGLIFIVRPWIIFGEEESLVISYTTKDIAIFLGVIASICYTVYYFLVRRTKIQLNILIYNQIYNLANMVLTPIGVFYEGFTWIGIEEALLILLMGFLHYFSQLCFNRGIQIDKTGKKSFLGYLQIFLSLGLDFILGIDVLLTTIIGAGLILASSFFLVFKSKNTRVN